MSNWRDTPHALLLFQGSDGQWEARVEVGTKIKFVGKGKTPLEAQRAADDKFVKHLRAKAEKLARLTKLRDRIRHRLWEAAYKMQEKQNS